MAVATQPDSPAPPRHSASLQTVLVYRRCDSLSGWLIYFMVVFGPWAFGTVQPWTIWTMNVSGYCLGLFLAAKWFIRKRTGYTVERWDANADKPSGMACFLTMGLATLTVAILAYCLIAVLNASATYDPVSMDFTYRSFIAWLPHSYDQERTVRMFARFLALACFFWAVRDWILGKTADEMRAARSDDANDRGVSFLPERLKCLLWVLSINGTVLALEGMIQRMSGTPKPLWLMNVRENREAISQFGPYAYRGNAAQYLNLLWPVVLGFWWRLRRELRFTQERLTWSQRNRSHLLLPCALIIAACPIISGSRAGAVVTFASIGVAFFILLLAMRRRHPAVKFALSLFFGAMLATGLYLGWGLLGERLSTSGSGFVEREKIYVTARQITHDYPVFGVGPGAFDPVFQLYRSSPDEYWPAQLHNDWLETLITFGWVGSSLIGLAFLFALARWFVPGGVRGSWQFVSLTWLALAGCLIHARYDFPLQIYSILMIFLLWCAILSALSRKSKI